MWILDVPTGDTPQEVEAYYDYLFSHWLSVTGGETWLVEWGLIFWLGVWIVILAGVFGAYSYWQRYTRAHREPYPLESYDGHIQEMNGPVGPFLWMVFATVFFWAVLLTIVQIRNGQIY